MHQARTEKAQGYRREAPRGTVFALADPEFSPLPKVTRACVLWDGAAYEEIDHVTGEVLERGRVQDESAAP